MWRITPIGYDWGWFGSVGFARTGRRCGVKNGRVLFEVSLAVGFGVVLGATGLALTLDNKPNNYAFLDPIITIKSQLDKTYVDVPDDKVLQAGAIKGMLDSLNDPYTVYVPPADRQEFNKSLTGE